MASLPNKIQKFSDLENDAFTTIAQANWQKAASLLEYANLSYPIGMLLFFYASQDNLPAQPDPNNWKFMDGTVVDNANSIYNGLTVPDLRGRFVRHPGTGEIFPAAGGVNSIYLDHTHGPGTHSSYDYGGLDLDNGGEVSGAVGAHSHTITGSFGLIQNPVSTIPAYREVQIYMRIV